jgi:NAD(P)-dependent dehydrogenase (short-subunit alcohol dehydrogenase family)
MTSAVAKGSNGVVLITGISRGIGAAIGLLAAKNGYLVGGNFSRDAEKAKSLTAQLLIAGTDCAILTADISKEAEVERLFRRVEDTLGPITALVNNAAITGGISRVDSVTAEMLSRVFEVNVVGSILCAREAVKRMSTLHGGKGGAIVNISSRAAHTGGAGEWVHYAATKGAIDTLTIGLAREVATEGIRVNAVAPGLIDTDLHANSGAPDRLARLSATVPMQRPGTAEEVAAAVLWLLSPAASYTTGAILEVGGGR